MRGGGRSVKKEREKKRRVREGKGVREKKNERVEGSKE
jgi:hypothetical protein